MNPERIFDGDVLLAILIPASAAPASTGFFTDDDANFQAGFVVYPSGGQVHPHIHLPVKRQITGTSELLVVRHGSCILDIYSNDRRLVVSRDLNVGDAVLSLSGGHGFRMTQDTVLFEVKQGPYEGVVEKQRFAPSDDPAPE